MFVIIYSLESLYFVGSALVLSGSCQRSLSGSWSYTTAVKSPGKVLVQAGIKALDWIT